MNILNIKEKDLSIIIPFKNGHTLLYSTFINLLNHLKIDFEIDYVNKSSDVLNNVYIFVRNPIDRFFSSYYWMQNMIDSDKKFKSEIEEIFNLTKINNIGSYIENYENFINNIDDFHFLPQSTEILSFGEYLVKQEIIDSTHNLKNLYETKFLKKYHVFKIEDIDIMVQKSITSIIDNESRYDDFSYKHEYEFLNFFPKESHFLFCTFYSYFKSAYDIRHHKKINYFKNITYDEYYKVCQYTSNELKFFGYDEKLIPNTEFKRTLI